MNTKQKLTLGIAAIFMVTLTIVGVTYAYFVTRVSGTVTESVNVQTAKVGSVEYQAGNGTDDFISLNNVLPGKTVYKTFKVTNTEEDATAIANYGVFITSTPTENTAQYVHGAGSVDACYQTTAGNSLGKSVTGDGSQAVTATAACFDGTSYNNIYVTLYKVAETVFNKFATSTDALPTDVTLTTPVYAENKLAAKSGTTATAATQDLASNVSIKGNEYHYYVLKVEYKSIDGNQNIENQAAVSIKASIK